MFLKDGRGLLAPLSDDTKPGFMNLAKGLPAPFGQPGIGVFLKLLQRNQQFIETLQVPPLQECFGIHLTFHGDASSQSQRSAYPHDKPDFAVPPERHDGLALGHGAGISRRNEIDIGLDAEDMRFEIDLNLAFGIEAGRDFGAERNALFVNVGAEFSLGEGRQFEPGLSLQRDAGMIVSGL